MTDAVTMAQHRIVLQKVVVDSSAETGMSWLFAIVFLLVYFASFS